MKLLLNYVDLKRSSIIFVTETWASPEITDGFYAVPGYKLMRADRLDRKGEGVLVFILEGMHSSQISLKSHFDFELVSFVVNSDNGNSCLLYTSPSPRDLSTSRMPSSA